MRGAAVEVVAVPRRQQIDLLADGHLHLAPDDDAALFPFVAQHVVAGVGARGQDLLHHADGPVGAAVAHQAVADGVSAEIRHVVRTEDHLGIHLRLVGEETGQGHGDAFQHLAQGGHGGAHLILFDLGDKAVGHTGAFGQLALGEGRLGANRLEAVTDIHR